MYNFLSFATVISALIVAVASIPVGSVPQGRAAVSNVPAQNLKATAAASDAKATPAHASDVLQPLVTPLGDTLGKVEPSFNEAEAHPRARGGQCIVA
ncbi:hypothetical protein R3P38DRAFT_2972714 [Favolaschia claudopus]|uniref:Hepcidin n=1 Tax=Favolaschia claudopus TaxID=2862362 RepID=A0AAW0B483_9AGAR